MRHLWQQAFLGPTPPGFKRLVRILCDIVALGLIAMFVLDKAFDRPGAGLGALLLAIASAVVARLAFAPNASRGPDDSLHGLLVMAVTGVGLLPTVAFAWHLVSGDPLREPILLASAAVVIVVSCVLLARRPGPATRPNKWLPIDLLYSAISGRGGVLVVATLIAGLYFLKHEGSLPPVTCIGEGAWVAFGENPQGIDLLRDNVGDSRLGNVGVISGSIALFEGEAFQVLYAALGWLLALGGYLIGLAVTGQRKWAWLAMLLLPLNPYVASIPLIDENLLAAGFCAALLALAVQQKPPWWLVGALMGLVFSMRHPFAASIPALFWLAWHDERRRRAMGSLALGIVAFSALEHLHHLLAFGSLLRFESTAQFDPLPYEVAGLSLQWPGMLNWPLHETLVRTPHNPFPMMWAWWLHLADHLGLLLLGLTLLGMGSIWWQRRRQAWFWLLWWLPIHVSLSLQESWDYPNKMGVMVIAMPALVAWTAAGAEQVWRRDIRTWLVLGGLVAAAWLAIWGLRDWQVPADTRYFARHDIAALESPSHLAAARARATDVGVLPDWSRLSRYGPIASPWKWRTLYNREPPYAWGWFAGEIPQPDKPITYEIDLREAIWQRHDFVRLTTAEPDIDLTGEHGQVIAGGVTVPWEPRPIMVTTLKGDKLTVVDLGLRPSRVRVGSCDPTTTSCRCRFYDTIEKGAAEVACRDSRVIEHKGPTLKIRSTSRGLSLIATVNEVANVVALWKVRVDGERLYMSQPVDFWHN